MATYQVYFLCPACKKKHRAPVHLELSRGPRDEESVEEVFGDKPRPPEVDNLSNTRFLCPRKKRYVEPSDQDLTLAREEVSAPATGKASKKAPAKKKSAKRSKR